MRRIKAGLAVLLVFCMAFPAVGEYEYTPGVGTTGVMDEQLDIDTSESGDYNKIEVTAESKDAGSVVTGDMTVVDDGWAEVVKAEVRGEGLTAAVDVKGDVSGTVQDGNTAGVIVLTNNGGNIDITIEGSVETEMQGTTAPGTDLSPHDNVAEYAQGINIHPIGNHASTNVTVEEGVQTSADRGPATGVVAGMMGDNSSVTVETGTVKADGVTATAHDSPAPNSSMPWTTGNATGVDAGIRGNSDTLEVTIGGDVSADGVSASGVRENINGTDNNGNVTVNGDVAATSHGGNSTGILADAQGEGTAAVSVTGDVQAAAETEGGQATGIQAVAENGTAEITVDGSVNSDGTGVSVHAHGQNQESSTEYGGSVDGFEKVKEDSVPIISPQYQDGTIETTNYYTYEDYIYRNYTEETIKDNNGNIVSNVVYTDGVYTGSLDGFTPKDFNSQPRVINVPDGTRTVTTYQGSKGGTINKTLEVNSDGEVVLDTCFWSFSCSDSQTVAEIVSGLVLDEESRYISPAPGKMMVENGYTEYTYYSIPGNDPQDQSARVEVKTEIDRNGNVVSETITTDGGVPYEGELGTLIPPDGPSRFSRWVEENVITEVASYMDAQTGTVYSYTMNKDEQGNIVNVHLSASEEYTGDLSQLTLIDGPYTNERIGSIIDGEFLSTVYSDQNGKKYTQIVEYDGNGNVLSETVHTNVEYTGSMDNFQKMGESIIRPRWFGGEVEGETVTTIYQDQNGVKYQLVETYDANRNKTGSVCRVFNVETVGVGEASVTVGKGVHVNGSGDLVGIETIAENGSKVDVQVLDGGITAAGSGKDASAVGAELTNVASEINLTVEGGITAGGAGNGDSALVINAEGKAETNVKIRGDVTSDDAGIEIGVSGSGAETKILVDGTVSGEKHSILLTEEKAENLSITVWQVVEHDGHVVEKAEADSKGNVSYQTDEETEKVEKAIQYIIRIQEDQKNLISTSGTTSVDGFDTAKEGETVYLKLNIPEGYEVGEAWQNGEKTISLLKDEKGDYYLSVPRGGGVTLSVTLKEIPKEEPKTEPSEAAEEGAPAAASENLAVNGTNAVNQEAGTTADIAGMISDLLMKNDVNIQADVSIETDPNGRKTLIVSPAVQEERAEDNTVLKLTVPDDVVKKLTEQNVEAIRMQSSDGTAEVKLNLADVAEIMDGKHGSRLIVECVNVPEMEAEIRSKVNENYEIIENTMVSVRILIQDENGNETEMSSGNYTVNLRMAHQEGMKILFIDRNGNMVETEAVWVTGSANDPGHWEVPYLGCGKYLPVIAK